MNAPYYQRHAFFCVNRREDGKRCCADFDAAACRDYAKLRMKDLAMHGRGMVRVNQCGCLDRCEQGPVLVVYPEAVWYTYVDREDIDEIVERHFLRGEIVERLRI
ncbi:MAG: (2Fe-2S) ferredoxin domain-containing protein [Gammaproteobacteria bacterium]